LADTFTHVARRLTVKESIYAQLRLSLMQGRFDPGEPLTIQQLADAFGASTTPVREALRQLTAEGGLQAMPNGSIQVPQVSRDTLLDLARARLALEGLATELACTHVDAKALRTLRGLITEHEQAIQHDGLYPSLEKNRAFHFLIYALSGSVVLPRLIESLWLQYGPYMRMISRTIEGQQHADFQRNGTDYHHALLAALEVRDARAARAAMERDIERTTGLLLDLLDARQAA